MKRQNWLAPVHPRACGEQISAVSSGFSSTGSSPRVRGTVKYLNTGSEQDRFIPARAGNRLTFGCRTGSTPVHPRACGEQYFGPYSIVTQDGSSPRVRGTDRPSRGDGRAYRFIPARAGNRARAAVWMRADSVHPRACGEQVFAEDRALLTSGSSPRVRGTGAQVVAVAPVYVHPRACGEQIRPPGVARLGCGSSPRVRGTGFLYLDRTIRHRFIPARAGNRRRALPRRCPSPVHPRACGEQSSAARKFVRIPGSSPRVRGTVGPWMVPAGHRRFIPARAGNSQPGRARSARISVHPRACGEQVRDVLRDREKDGSSPRVRGTGSTTSSSGGPGRFIPARAGNSRSGAIRRR